MKSLALTPKRRSWLLVLLLTFVFFFLIVTHALAGTGLVLAIGAAYFLPTIVAAARKVPNQGSVFVINVFLGWTLIGWVVALAMAARSRIVPVVEESLTR